MLRRRFQQKLEEMRRDFQRDHHAHASILLAIPGYRRPSLSDAKAMVRIIDKHGASRRSVMSMFVRVKPRRGHLTVVRAPYSIEDDSV